MANLVDGGRELSCCSPKPFNSAGNLTIYTGISNRTRGWKSRKSGDSMEGRIPPSAGIKRWDGTERACAAWDNLRRDPELWFKNGNCFVHLYGKGQSRRGPAFKVPLASLLEANCNPLLNRYLLRDVPESASSYSTQDLWTGANAAGRVDLYIPPPSMADKKQALQFHLAMRNLFAWIYKRPMVGEHLGGALIALMDSMVEFRTPGADNVEDMMVYLEEVSYLEMANQPIHALAMLHLSEFFQLKDLYINAFAHCAGMGDCLYILPEYQAVSSVTRKLLRRAQTGLERKLSEASVTLRNFLEDDFSEANLGLSAGGRAHLERFRTFLLAFYTNRLGYYPPSPIDTRSGMWDAEIYRTMRNDFESLYEFLVDRSFTTSDSGSYLGQGGICALQSVHTFDLRHKYKPLPHPLPLLPELASSTASKRMSWFGKSDSKLRPDRRLLTHAALLKATNSGRPDLTRNSLVVAYRRFEEDSLCAPTKFDKMEKLSQVDARKIRWILIYGVYQTLWNCTEPPAEVRETNGVSYSLSISTTDLPPWKESPRQQSTPQAKANPPPASSLVPSLPSSGTTTPSTNGDIRPDVDYFALTHKDPSSLPSSKRLSTASSSSPVAFPPIPPRTGSLTRAFSRKPHFRISLASLRAEPRVAPPIEPASARAKRNTVYHEIVVQGYGNGTNRVCVEEGDAAGRPGLANRSPSTASSSSAESSAAESDGSPRSEESWGSGETGLSIPDALPEGDKEGRRRTSVASGSSSVYSTPEEVPCPPLPRRSSQRKSVIVTFDERDGGLALAPAPLVVRKGTPPRDEREEWLAIEEAVNERCEAIDAFRETEGADDGVVLQWDLFKGVGGLTAAMPRYC